MDQDFVYIIGMRLVLEADAEKAELDKSKAQAQAARKPTK